MSGFDHQRARRLLRRRDRDAAPFFAGRRDEIRRFDDALEELEDRDEYDERAAFRVYQGAPGCGKTSLVSHLRKTRSHEVGLFVDIQREDLASVSALTERVRRAVEDADSAGNKLMTRFAQALASYLKVDGSGTELRNILADRTARKTKVVLHMDEAQVVEPSEQPGLLVLHTRGLGAPCVCVLTGLSHTSQKLGSIEGLSRLAGDAIVNMGAMSDDECVESTLMMLGELGIGGEPEADQAATVAAALSQGWPQHLHGAQTALCRELVRTNGVLREVDADRVRQESEERRHDYYIARLSHSVLALHPPFTAGIIDKVNQQPLKSIVELNALCDEEMTRAGLADDPYLAEVQSGGFAKALIEKGVVAITPNGGCEVAIPSMAVWAAARIDDPQAAARP